MMCRSAPPLSKDTITGPTTGTPAGSTTRPVTDVAEGVGVGEGDGPGVGVGVGDGFVTGVGVGVGLELDLTEPHPVARATIELSKKTETQYNDWR